MKSFIFVVLLLASTVGKADFLTGNDLLTRLNSKNNVLHANALGYVSGIADQFEYSRKRNPSEKDFCFSLPREADLKQVGDVVQKWLENNPELRHLGAPGLVASGLEKAFPCK